MVPKLVVMLTHNDRTVENAIEVFDQAKDAKAIYWGFKEVGIPLDQMQILAKHMKDAGKRVFLEVVAYTEEECYAGAEMGVKCGVDVVMGTLYFPSIAKMLSEHGVGYMPFVGKLEGRPTVMRGTIEETIEEGNHIKNEPGVTGIDLLGYRFVGDAHELNKRFVAAMGPKCPVCVAGSINNFERLDAVTEFQCESFTIGGAFFEHQFGKDKSFGEQIDVVIDYLESIAK